MALCVVPVLEEVAYEEVVNFSMDLVGLARKCYAHMVFSGGDAHTLAQHLGWWHPSGQGVEDD